MLRAKAAVVLGAVAQVLAAAVAKLGWPHNGAAARAGAKRRRKLPVAQDCLLAAQLLLRRRGHALAQHHGQRLADTRRLHFSASVFFYGIILTA